VSVRVRVCVCVQITSGGMPFPALKLKDIEGKMEGAGLPSYSHRFFSSFFLVQKRVHFGSWLGGGGQF